MGSKDNCIIHCRNRRLIISMLFLLISNYTDISFRVEGRAVSKRVEISLGKEEMNMSMARILIGSRPPRCERRCASCGHCEAVQVPVEPQLKSQQTMSHRLHATPTTSYSRGDAISNYKPTCWKCKCGDFIFNP